MYAYGLRWGSRLPPGLAGNPTRLSLASVGPTAPSTEENSTLEGWRLLLKKLLSIRCYPTFSPLFFYPLAPTAATLGHNRAHRVLYRFGSGWVRRLALIIGAPTPPICLSFVNRVRPASIAALFPCFPPIDARRLILEAAETRHCFSLTMATFKLLEDRRYS